MMTASSASEGLGNPKLMFAANTKGLLRIHSIAQTMRSASGVPTGSATLWLYKVTP